MTAAMLERLLWCVTVVAAGTAVAGARTAEVPIAAGAPVVPASPAEPRVVAPEALDAGAASVVETNPFRLSRRPATVAYSPALEGLEPAPVAQAPRPNLVVRGIVGGPPWSAIIEGIPGRDGSVLLRRGDTIAALLVRAVRRDTVVVEGADTTWRLTVKRRP